MNVLYLTNNAGRASTTVSTRGWFENLMPRGLRPVVVSPLVGEFSEWMAGQGLATYQLELPFPSKKNPVRFLRSLWKLRGIVRKHDIQLIHSNEQDVYPIAQYLARWCRLPIVVTVHCRMNPGFSRWAFRGKRCPDRIFFISQGNMDACREGVSGRIPEDRWRLLHNGIDLARYTSSAALRERFRREQNLGEGLLIGVASALRPGKQLEHSFQAAARLDDAEFKFVLAGGPIPGFEEYGEAVIAAGRDILKDRFVHLGYVTDMQGFYNALDLCVNASEGEACSISIVESLACGCPVVGYPSISVHEQVLPDGGEIVEQDNIDQLSDAIKRWVADPERLRAQRASARKQAERFDLKKLSNQLWDEYESLLETDSSREHKVECTIACNQ